MPLNGRWLYVLYYDIDLKCSCEVFMGEIWCNIRCISVGNFLMLVMGGASVECNIITIV